ncbi:MAG TPA: caspase family protein [Xanthobacteraceae bacterium]|nr:caspase family protein [Xanthobacteraceae bacterium]
MSIAFKGAGSFFRSSCLAVSVLGSMATCSLMFATDASAQVATLRPPQGGEVRALVIGIDAYQFVPPLRGAVADARDIESTLRRQGVTDITALYDAAADRGTVMRTLGELVQRSRPGDLVVLSIAGHGVQEPEHVKGSQPDGLDNVFVLAGFNPKTGAGTQQRIIGTEFNHVIRQFESKGTYVMFVADTCYGGGLAREIDPRAGELSYRQAPRYSLTVDNLQPISTASDAFLSDIDFQRTAFLAAVDRNTKAPEVRIPGVPGFRGALSYAVARAFEGAADVNRDDRVSQTELFSYVRQVAYQLSDQRQQVVTAGPIARNVDAEAVFERTRAVVLLDAVQPAETRPQAPSSQPPAATASPGTQTTRPPALPERPPAVATALGTVRIAVLGNQRDLLANLEAREARFEVVATKDNPDLIWDPVSHDVLAGADVVARGIDRADLASVIDRVAAVNGFKRLAAKGPQAVRLLPDDKVHRRDARIEVQVSGIAQRALLMFNIAGDGTVQSLYPYGSDKRIIDTPDYKFSVRVGEPFGADQVVAISSAQRLGDLEEALKKMSQRRTAVEVFKLVERYAPADARIGATSIYTAP